MSRRGVLILAGLALLLWLDVAAVRADPFTGRHPESPAAAPHVERAQGPLAVVGRALLTFQREANRMIAQHMRAIRDGETSAPLMIGDLLAFAYGVLHALGPGHGKVFVVSYFLSRDAQIMRGLLMGLQIAGFHVLSAAVVVALADLVLRQAFGGASAEVAGVRLTSYGLIALIGVGMTGQALRRSYLRRHGIEVSAACCDHGHASHLEHHRHTGPGRRVERGGAVARRRSGAVHRGGADPAVRDRQ